MKYVCVRRYVHESGPIKSFNGPRTYTLLVSSSVLVHTKHVASAALNLRAFFDRGFGAWQRRREDGGGESFGDAYLSQDLG